MKKQYIITKGITFDRKVVNNIGVKILSEIGDLYALVEADEDQFKQLRKEEGKAIKSINESKKVSVPRQENIRFEYNIEKIKREESGEQ
jgi:hypothetical protein